jgi:hypothetical protein
MRPQLSFFVELEEEPLCALFVRPEVTAFLAGQRAGLSMGLVDLSRRRAEVVRRLEAAGIPVTAWLLLDLADGYWLNADNAPRARERWLETAAWAAREGLCLPRVGLDIEFPRSESHGILHDRRGALRSMLRRRRSRERVREAEAAYAALVGEIRASGRCVEAYHFPHLLDERAAGTTLLRRALGLVDVPVDAEVYMLYASYLGRAGARAYFRDAPGIALGVTGGGVQAHDPEARRRFLAWEALEEDLRAAAASSPQLYVFSLEGCVERGWLPRFAEIRWDEPPPPLPRGERLRARWSRFLTRHVLRAEPHLDPLFTAAG